MEGRCMQVGDKAKRALWWSVAVNQFRDKNTMRYSNCYS